ncbi:MAG: riboflavin synthase subunit alpha [Pseudomonadota bacterium]
MFTGIVQGYRRVLGVRDDTDLRGLTIDMQDMIDGLELGASVAINGTCLTVTHVAPDGAVAFDVIRETLNHTNLGELREGDLVDVERSFRVGDEVGGHIVSGHIATTVEVVRVEQSDNLRKLWFAVGSEWRRYLLHKGYAALDGASLTISDLDDDAGCFAVSLIPETIERTRLGRVEVGDRVNLEVDSQTQGVVATVERLFADPEWRERVRDLVPAVR